MIPVLIAGLQRLLSPIDSPTGQPEMKVQPFFGTGKTTSSADSRGIGDNTVGEQNCLGEQLGLLSTCK